MDQSFNTWFEFNEGAIIGQAHNFTFHNIPHRIFDLYIIPRMGYKLFESK